MTMKTLLRMSAAVALAALASGFGANGGPAVAQSEDTELEEIVVLRTPLTVRYPEGRSPTGVPYEVIELTRTVGYSDLDLTDQSDVDKLHDRIETTAEETCQQLSNMMPLDIDASEVRSCTKKAVSDAMEDADAAVASAKAPDTPAQQARQAAQRAAQTAERAARAAEKAADAAHQAASNAEAAREQANNLQ